MRVVDDVAPVGMRTNALREEPVAKQRAIAPVQPIESTYMAQLGPSHCRAQASAASKEQMEVRAHQRVGTKRERCRRATRFVAVIR